MKSIALKCRLLQYIPVNGILSSKFSQYHCQKCRYLSLAWSFCFQVTNVHELSSNKLIIRILSHLSCSTSLVRVSWLFHNHEINLQADTLLGDNQLITNQALLMVPQTLTTNFQTMFVDQGDKFCWWNNYVCSY